MKNEMSFYRFLMTLRDPDDYNEVVQFANNAFYDQSFPKQLSDYEGLSQYLEMNGNYLPSMTIFDDAWQKYLEKIQ